MVEPFLLYPSSSILESFSLVFGRDPQIDVLQAEVTALKTLVLTSTPSSPNRQLHPQLQSPSTRGAYKHHSRNKSMSSTIPEPSSVSIQPVSKEEREVS